MNRWSTAELDTLKKDYPSVTNRNLSKRLHRHESEISRKANEIGLLKYSSARYFYSIGYLKKDETLSDMRMYKIWTGMKVRCGPKCEKRIRGHYFEKGIRVCKEWQSFIKFFRWSIENGYAEDLSIDRIDGNKNYCPDNCRWATEIQQKRNTSRNRQVTAFGETKPVAAWVEDDRCNISYETLTTRLNTSGLSNEDCITLPKQKGKKW